MPGFVRTALLAGRLSLVFNTLAQDPQVASKANESVARGTERCGDDDTGNQKCFHVSVISSSAVMLLSQDRISGLANLLTASGAAY